MTNIETCNHAGGGLDDQSAREIPPVEDRIEAGEPLLGTQLGINDPSVIELFGRAGYDWAVIDTEHSAHTPVTVKHMLQAALGWDIVPVVRPRILDHDAIRMWLDIGATSILCPYVEASEPIVGGADHRLAVIGAGEVGWDEVSIASGRDELATDALASLEVAAGDHDAGRAASAQRAGRRLTQALRPAGHESDLAGERRSDGVVLH